MNIFSVHNAPVRAAQMLCDQHVRKMILETAQLLCGPHAPGVAPYKRTHYNVRYAKWTRASLQNYMWLLAHGFALGKEYIFRFNKRHASHDVVQWCANHYRTLQLPSTGRTRFPTVTGYDHQDPVEANRQFYIDDKRDFATWVHGRLPPTWWLRAYPEYVGGKPCENSTHFTSEK